jgi:hypothetical protein
VGVRSFSCRSDQSMIGAGHTSNRLSSILLSGIIVKRRVGARCSYWRIWQCSAAIWIAETGLRNRDLLRAYSCLRGPIAGCSIIAKRFFLLGMNGSSARTAIFL